MNKVIVSVMLGMVFLTAPAYGADSCEYNSIVQGWIVERDREALNLVRAWLSGEPKETLAPFVGLVWTSETKITALCRNETDFLDRHCMLYGNLTFPLTVDTVPPLLFERLVKDDILSPGRQYRKKGKEVRYGKKR